MDLLYKSFRQGVPGFTASLELKDVNGLGEFKNAFRYMFFVSSRVKPWDRQMEPLWDYMEDKDYFRATITPHNFLRVVDPGVLCSGNLLSFQG